MGTMKNRWPGNPSEVVPVADVAVKEIQEFEHEAGEDGYLQYDINTLEIQPTKWPHGPIKLPEQFEGVDQPFVSTCSRPTETNRGCHAHGGCPYRNYPYIGPFNVIVKRRRKTEYVPCYNFFHAKGRDGVRAATLSYKSEGFEIDTTRTTVEWDTASVKVNPDGTKTKTVKKVLVEVPNLGPMYDHLKKGKSDGHHGSEAGKGSEVPGGSGDGRTGHDEDPGLGGRGRGASGRPGRGGSKGRVQGSRMAQAEPEGQEAAASGSHENHKPARGRRGDLSKRRAEVQANGVRPEVD